MTSGKTPRISIVRLEDYAPASVDRALEDLLEPFGGMEGIVGGAKRVVMKPNFLWSSGVDRAICTHPEIIRAASRSAAAASGSRVTVTDSPGVGTATRCARALDLAEEADFSILDADDGVQIGREGQPRSYHRLFLSQRMLESDCLINLPKAKTHGQMVVTAAVKNTFGAVVGFEKAQWHFRAGRDPMAFARLLVEIHEALPVRISILDAVIGMEGNGPGSGDPRKMGILVAGDDAHAIDTTLCEIWGVDPGSVYTLRAAAEMGLTPLLEEIEIIGPRLEELRPSPPWKLARPNPLRKIAGPAWFVPVMDRLLSLRPEVSPATCIGCGHCVKACAAEAMTMVPSMTRPNAVVEIDRKKCISCFCCQEICPQGAIEVKTGPVARILGLGRLR